MHIASALCLLFLSVAAADQLYALHSFYEQLNGESWTSCGQSIHANESRTQLARKFWLEWWDLVRMLTFTHNRQERMSVASTELHVLGVMVPPQLCISTDQ